MSTIGQVNDLHPFDLNNRGGAAAYIKEGGAWVRWDGSAKNRAWNPETLSWESITAHPLTSYELSDWTDEVVNPQYHGFLRPDGGWVIKRIDASTSPRSVRFARGASDYATNWTGRAGLTYQTFDVVF